MKEIKIAPSILSANFSKLGDEIEEVVRYGADLIHVDVMDGHFVPNITIGPLIVKAIRPFATVPLDVHLMITNPEAFIPDFLEAGADMISFHVEATPHVQRALQMIKRAHVRAAVALTPSTPLTAVEHILPDLDMILLMTVNPGFGGQSFIPQMVEKTAALRQMLIDRKMEQIDIEVDGGIGEQTAGKIVKAGANVLVAGSSIFGSKDRKAAIEMIRREGSLQ